MLAKVELKMERSELFWERAFLFLTHLGANMPPARVGMAALSLMEGAGDALLDSAVFIVCRQFDSKPWGLCRSPTATKSYGSTPTCTPDSTSPNSAQ